VNLDELLADKRVCVCAGSGGVGKTTTAAAVALGMAAGGARVAVVTIDPARRLANALGLEELDNEPSRVDPERLRGAGLEVAGELWAMMLDPKRTFDELIDRVSPSVERSAEIKSNRVYRELSTAVSGSQEFTAVSKLYELAEEGGFDLLVLDTPPSRSALEFLEAPGRLTSFLEGRALNAFMRPTGLGMRVLGFGAGPLLGALRRVTGLDVIAEITTFFKLLGGMTSEFSARAARVEQLLHSPETAFLLVTSAESEPIDEAIWFRRALAERDLPFAGAVVNRFHHDQADGAVAGDVDLEAGLAQTLAPELAARVAATFADYHVLAQRDARNVARLTAALEGQPMLLVPQLDDDIHDVAGLAAIHRYLFASESERASLIDDAVA
jgi:anion-transporting  ArsA/GET3 family ATPase